MKKNILLAVFGVFLGTATFANIQLNEKGKDCCKPKKECCTEAAACCK